MTIRCWLLLEKSDETRVSKGIDGYLDKTGGSYCYDSFVPNYKRLKGGDWVVIRKEDEILGVGKVGPISEASGTKIHRRCPECNKTDIRERSTKTPTWKCGSCTFEFMDPFQTLDPVQSFAAPIERFTRLDTPPSVLDVKQCALGGNGVASQLSILELDPTKLKSLSKRIAPPSSPRD